MNYKRVLLSYFSITFFLVGCASKEDIEFKKLEADLLKEDVFILKKIVLDMHAGAFTYNTESQLNKIFDSISIGLTQPLTLREFYNKIDYLTSSLRCVHTEAYFPDQYYDSINERPMFFPIALIEIDEKLYVNSDMQSIPLGAEIMSINNINTADIIQDLERYNHHDGFVKQNNIGNEFAYHYFLKYGGYPSFSIQYWPDSSKKMQSESFYAEKLSDLYANAASTNFYYFSTDVDYDLEIDGDDETAVLTIRTFHYQSSNSLKAFKNFLHNSFRLIKQNGIKNLIIDCRENGGGFYNPTYSLLSYLIKEKLPEYDSAYQRFQHLSYTKYIAPEDSDRIAEIDTQYVNCTKLNNGFFKLKNDQITQWEPQKSVFQGRLFVIINGKVASAASTFAAVLKERGNATIVGEESGGAYNTHNAQMLGFVLPNSKIKVDIPLRQYFQPVKKNFNGKGVIPDKVVTTSLEDVKNNIDAPLSFIYDSILKK